nr:3'(2'),5'-bisphosphate nucleotidase CysQ [Pseudomonadota bacterium]
MIPNIAVLAPPVRRIAQEAGQRILDIYRLTYTVTRKADHTPVTEADLAAHDCILHGLAGLTPGIPVLSEESPAAELRERRQWEWLWLVDPLDGTREFISGSGEFSVNIALVHRHAAVFGLILIPISGVCYFAWRHGGAYRQLPGHPPEPVHTRRVGHHPVRIAGSRASYNGRALQAFLTRLGHHDYIGVGSALKSCLVAEGKVDLYPRFGPTSEWDTAAAQIIVEEAGGRLTDDQLRPLRYNARATLINPDFFVFGAPDYNWSQYLPHR